jgi:hypothetical protein
MTIEKWKEVLEIIANIAAILTAVLASWFWIYYQYDLYKKRVRVINYLREEQNKGDQGQRSIRNIMAGEGLTEADVYTAVFSTSGRQKISCHKKSGPDKLTRELLFSYKDTPKS